MFPLFGQTYHANPSSSVMGGRRPGSDKIIEGILPFMLKLGVFLMYCQQLHLSSSNNQVLFFKQLPVQHVLDAWPEEGDPGILA